MLVDDARVGGHQPCVEPLATEMVQVGGQPARPAREGVDVRRLSTCGYSLGAWGCGLGTWGYSLGTWGCGLGT